MENIEKYLNKFYNFIDKIGKHNFVLIVFIFIALLTTTLYQTFSLYTESEGLSILDGIETYSFILNNSNNTNSVTIAAGNTKYIDVTVHNTSNANLGYNLYYSSNSNLEYVNIGYLTKDTLPSGVINAKENYIVMVKVENYSLDDITINFGVIFGFENGGELVLGDDQIALVEYSVIEDGMVNAPNLDEGNLIPVYYDDSNGVETWKVADYLNRNNSWYDYSDKMWANAVIIDPNATTDYSSSAIGTPVTESDIIAFYVWIPRYKYRVWDLNRQGISETGTGATVYAYPAFTNGIDIEFEKDTDSTGNIECIYDTTTIEAETNLSDKCYYNGATIPIKTTDLNTDYTDTWYTHPAFTFGGNPIEGFWIGKFETSAETTSTCYTDPSSNNCNKSYIVPRILPDVSSLRWQNVANQFTASKKFQNYLSNEIDAHMLTNLEWGAVAYLTHSIYGLCNGTTCEGVNHNNSSNYYTGRSGGEIAGNGEVSAYGTYDYKGYQLSDNQKTDTKDITKIASTTGNITGVYDMSGGAYENVMGNMVDTSNNFDSTSLGTNWNGSSNLDVKYINLYSYGENYSKQKAYNRGRLGDATVEVLGGVTSSSAWQPGSGMTGSSSYFVYSSNSWFYRGGHASNANSDEFYFSGHFGSSDSSYSFRSSLS